MWCLYLFYTSCVMQSLVNIYSVEAKRKPFVRHIVVEGLKKPIFGSYSYDPIRQVFDVIKDENSTHLNSTYVYSTAYPEHSPAAPGGDHPPEHAPEQVPEQVPEHVPEPAGEHGAEPAEHTEHQEEHVDASPTEAPASERYFIFRKHVETTTKSSSLRKANNINVTSKAIETNEVVHNLKANGNLQ